MSNNTLAHIRNITDNNAISYRNNVHFEGDKIHFKGSQDKQNLTLVVISYEIYETCQMLISYISYEINMSVRSSMSVTLTWL